ncbi:MAG: choice-of-anchor D domain-containing protein [Chlorobi bacterium]|nr:choice-of-anchor D domain-containing protein [Chlorobiota bacterium]
MMRLVAFTALGALFVVAARAQIFRLDERDFPTVRVWYIPRTDQETAPPQRVRDNGKDVAIVEHSCASIAPSTPTEVTLCLDVSSSMAVHAASRALLDTIAATLAELLPSYRFHVVRFANTAHSQTDLDAGQLRDAVSRLSFGGGTDYTAAFEEAARWSSRSSWLVFVTDGLDTIAPLRIRSLFGQRPPRIAVIMLRNETPDCLRELARDTDGGWFELITSPDAAADATDQLARLIAGRRRLCSLRYDAVETCAALHDVQLQFPLASYGMRYRATTTASLELSTSHVYFGVPIAGSVRDAEITLTARKAPIRLDSVWMVGSPNFSVAATAPAVLVPDRPTALAVRYRARDTNAAWGELHILTSCGKEVVTFSVGRRNAPALRSMLRMIEPVGGELFFSGTLVPIEWLGVPPDDTCRIRMFASGGRTEVITSDAAGGRYLWKVPPLNRAIEARLRIEPIASNREAITDPIQLLPTDGILRPVDMGQATIGRRKDSVIAALITNTSSELPLVVERIAFEGAAAGEFGIAQGVFPVTIPPGGSLDVELYFRPTERGRRSAEMLLVSPSGYVRQVIWGHGIGTAPQHFIVDFGAVPIGSERDERLDLGRRIAGAIARRGDTAVFAAWWDTEHAAHLSLRFRPDSVRVYRAVFTLGDSIGSATIEMTGRGIAPALPSFAADPTRFRTLVQPTAEPVAAGTLGVGTFDGVGLLGIYAPTESLAILAGGLIPVRFGDRRSSAYGLGVRYVHMLGDDVGIAAGVMAGQSIGERSTDTTTISVAAPFATATFRLGRARLNVGIGYAFKEHRSALQRFRSDATIVAIGGDYQFAERWKIAADVFRFGTVESLPIAVAVRHFWQRLVLEAGVLVGIPTASSQSMFAAPLVSAFWMFR